MTDLYRQCLLLLAVVASLVACGKKDEPPATPASAPASVTAAEVLKPDALKAAWIYVGPVTDAGSTFAHDQGRKAAETELGDRVQTTFVEGVAEGERAEGVLRDLAAKGNKLIFATSSGYMAPVLKVAAEFPDVKFENASGSKMAANVRLYEAKFFEAAYLAGVIAGKMTKTNVLGFVGSVPAPEALRNLNAFALGAQSVNPKVKTRIAWVNARFDPPKEGEAAQNLINSGADVLLQNTDSTAVLQAAERNGKYAFGWNGDMSAFAPNAHLASCIVDWSPYYKKASQEVIDGTWSTGRTVMGAKENQSALVKIADRVPIEVKERIEFLSVGLKNGAFSPYTGPLVDSAGNLRLAAGTVADQDWLDRIDFYVKGVEGKAPSPLKVTLK